MTEPRFAHQGHFCWPELATTDLASAKAHYEGLFGWTSFDVPTAEGNYTIFQVEGLDVAGAYQMGAHQSAPPHWNSYVKVASADESSAKAEALGAEILMAPFDIPNVGRMGFFRDPGGASLALWQGREHQGAAVFDRPGALCWTELNTRDADQAIAFYTALFGWRAHTKTDFGMPYTEFYLGDLPVGGLMVMAGPEWEGVPSAWMPYIAVSDAEGTAAKVTAQGGTLLVPPTDVPTVGRFAVAQDAQGAVLSFIKLLDR